MTGPESPFKQARIDECFWTDPKIWQLKPDERLLFLWFISNPNRHFSGLFYFHPALIIEQTGLTDTRIHTGINTLTDRGLIEVNWDFRVVWVKSMLKRQTAGQSKLSHQQAKGIANHLLTLHNCPLISKFLAKNAALNIPYSDTPIHTPMDTPRDTISTSTSTSTSKKKESRKFSPDELAKLWNETMPAQFSRVTIPLNNGRKNKFRPALTEFPNIDWWKNIFEKVSSIPGLSGENDRGWRADLEFVVKNRTKIVEGKYDTWGKTQQKTTPPPIKSKPAWQGATCPHQAKPAECPICRQNASATTIGGK